METIGAERQGMWNRGRGNQDKLMVRARSPELCHPDSKIIPMGWSTVIANLGLGFDVRSFEAFSGPQKEQLGV